MANFHNLVEYQPSDSGKIKTTKCPSREKLGDTGKCNGYTLFEGSLVQMAYFYRRVEYQPSDSWKDQNDKFPSRERLEDTGKCNGYAYLKAA